jgi:excisionase family DNA binding protein
MNPQEQQGDQREERAGKRPRISYSVEEAAEETGIGRSYIYLAMKHGELASLKLGKRRLIMHDDLVSWLQSKRQAA